MNFQVRVNVLSFIETSTPFQRRGLCLQRKLQQLQTETHSIQSSWYFPQFGGKALPEQGYGVICAFVAEVY